MVRESRSSCASGTPRRTNDPALPSPASSIARLSPAVRSPCRRGPRRVAIGPRNYREAGKRAGSRPSAGIMGGSTGAAAPRERVETQNKGGGRVARSTPGRLFDIRPSSRARGTHAIHDDAWERLLARASGTRITPRLATDPRYRARRRTPTQDLPVTERELLVCSVQVASGDFQDVGRSGLRRPSTMKRLGRNERFEFLRRGAQPLVSAAQLAALLR